MSEQLPKMLLQRFQPHPLLVPHIESIWSFESKTGLPTGDLRTVAPNGRPKLIIPYSGTLFSSINHQSRAHPESSITVVGMMETPVIIDGRGNIGTIGVEFKTASAYRFFCFALKDITNTVHSLDELLGQAGRELQQKLGETILVEEKIRLVEAFLIQRLYLTSTNNLIIDYAVKAIEANAGLLRIEDLCRELGYSKRYLDMKFADHVGLSPKTLARIVRFQQFYKRWGQGISPERFNKDLYEYYYDQAHFIKEFKRFTGHAPLSFGQQPNEFGRIFYQD